MRKLIKEVLGMNKRTGYAYGVTVTGELFLGYINTPFGLEFYKDTDENRSFVEEQFNFYKNY